MRVLLDTNVLIHREAATVVRTDIRKLFFWLDRLKYEKCVHPLSTLKKSKSTRTSESAAASKQNFSRTTY